MPVEKSDNFLIENALGDGSLYLDSVDSRKFPVSVRGVNDGSEYDPNGKTVKRERNKAKKRKVKDESGFVPLKIVNR